MRAGPCSGSMPSSNKAGRSPSRVSARHARPARSGRELLTRLAEAEARAATHAGPDTVARLRGALGGRHRGGGHPGAQPGGRPRGRGRSPAAGRRRTRSRPRWPSTSVSSACGCHRRSSSATQWAMASASLTGSGSPTARGRRGGARGARGRTAALPLQATRPGGPPRTPGHPGARPRAARGPRCLSAVGGHRTAPAVRGPGFVAAGCRQEARDSAWTRTRPGSWRPPCSPGSTRRDTTPAGGGGARPRAGCGPPSGWPPGCPPAIRCGQRVAAREARSPTSPRRRRGAGPGTARAGGRRLADALQVASDDAGLAERLAALPPPPPRDVPPPGWTGDTCW